MIRDDREARDLDAAGQAMLSRFTRPTGRDLVASGERPIWNVGVQGSATSRMSPDPEDSPDEGEDGLPDTEMEGAIDEPFDSMADAAEDGVFTPREIRRVDDALAAYQALNDTSAPPEECADAYAIPWGEANPDCLSNTGPLVEVSCDVPCIYTREAPTSDDIAFWTASLEIDTNGVSDADEWVELITTSWTLLRQNLDLIRFIACVISGNPAAGDCIVGQIVTQEPSIILDDEPLPEHSMLAGVDLLTTVLSTLFGGLLGGAAGAAAGSTHIRLFVNHITSRERMHAWEVEPLCGAVAVAGALLHEVSHECERDLFDSIFYPHYSWSVFDRNCPFAQLMASCFEWMVVQRYPINRFSLGCCAEYFLPDTWMREFSRQPEYGCGSTDDPVDLPNDPTGKPDVTNPDLYWSDNSA